MKNCIKILQLLLIGLLSLNLHAAIDSVFYQTVNKFYNEITQTENINLKLQMNDSLINYISHKLEKKESLNTSYDSIENIGILKSKDNSLVIYNWFLQLSIDIYQYAAIVQRYDKELDSIFVYILMDKSDKITDYEKFIGTDSSWYGALYYEMIEKEISKNKTYTLLGFDYNSTISRKKIIDILYFENNQLKFGYPAFKSKNKVANRIIFEYSSNAVMALNYDEKTEQIIFDHLSPVKSTLEGHSEFYGPDFSYDAFKFINDSWIYIPEIDIKNPKQKK